MKIECPNAGKKFAAEEISALVLRKLIDDSAKFLNDKVCCSLHALRALVRRSAVSGTWVLWLLICGFFWQLSGRRVGLQQTCEVHACM